jgi:integrase
LDGWHGSVAGRSLNRVLNTRQPLFRCPVSLPEPSCIPNSQVIWSPQIVNNTLHGLVTDYLHDVKVGRATSRRDRRGVIPGSATVRQYRTILEDVFLPWADSVALTKPEDLTEAALDRFTEHLRTRPGAKGRALSPTTVKTYARGTNLMLAWATRQGEIPAVRIVTNEIQPPRFELLTRAEIAALVKAADNPRDRLIIRLLADTGMRLGELLNLEVGDIVREGGRHFLLLRGKTGHRTAGIERDLYRDLMSYIKGGRKGPVDVGAAVFMSERKSSTGYKPLKASGVQQMLDHLGEDAGITKRVYPHLLRHTYATEALNRGMPETVLARVLGHKSLAMISRVYVHLADDDVQRAMLEHLDRVRQRE